MTKICRPPPELAGVGVFGVQKKEKKQTQAFGLMLIASYVNMKFPLTKESVCVCVCVCSFGDWHVRRRRRRHSGSQTLWVWRPINLNDVQKISFLPAFEDALGMRTLRK